jgi:hypothetical protein
MAPERSSDESTFAIRASARNIDCRQCIFKKFQTVATALAARTFRRPAK